MFLPESDRPGAGVPPRSRGSGIASSPKLSELLVKRILVVSFVASFVENLQCAGESDISPKLTTKLTPKGSGEQVRLIWV